MISTRQLLPHILLFVVCLSVRWTSGQQQNTSTIPQIIETAYGFLEDHLERGTRCWPSVTDPNVTKCYHYHFCRPSGKGSKYAAGQWLWDSGSHMITWSHRNATNSILDLRTMLQMQHDDGFIPETTFWPVQNAETNYINDLWYGTERETKNTQMPVLAHSLRAIWNATKDLSLLQEFVPKLVRYWEWWANTRVVSDSGLVTIIHGWESGLDASPMYDEAYEVGPHPEFYDMYQHFMHTMLGYHYTYNWNMTAILHRDKAPTDVEFPGWFFVEDVGVNSIYASGWEVLADLAEEMGNTTWAAELRGRAQHFADRIVAACWNSTLKRFVSRYRARDGSWHPASENTVQSLLPILLNISTEYIDSIINTQLLNESQYWLPYPVPSTSASSAAFTPIFTVDLMWRGPTWAFPTWYIMEGLQRHGHVKILNELMDRWIALVKLSGIWEMYNPIDGSNYGVEGLGMSCLIVDWLYRLGRA